MMRLEALAAETTDNSAIKDLHGRLVRLGECSSARSARLEAMVTAITDLTKNVKSLEDWIMLILQDLQGNDLEVL